jgi:tRNA (adenine57-N1/adenine58-N1)-methyltransferase
MLNPDLFGRFARRAQVITLKDAGAIAAFTGLGAGDRVVDAGAGSGFLAAFLANAVGPQGRVTTYESNPEHARVARQNLERAGLRNVELKEQDVFAGIGERDVHLVTLDLPDGGKALAHAFGALVPGGWCVGYLPHAEQLKGFVLEGERAGFRHERSLEVIAREWLVRGAGTRPENTGLTHTAFLAFLRKPFGK